MWRLARKPLKSQFDYFQHQLPRIRDRGLSVSWCGLSYFQGSVETLAFLFNRSLPGIRSVRVIFCNVFQTFTFRDQCDLTSCNLPCNSSVNVKPRCVHVLVSVVGALFAKKVVGLHSFSTRLNYIFFFDS